MYFLSLGVKGLTGAYNVSCLFLPFPVTPSVAEVVGAAPGICRLSISSSQVHPAIRSHPTFIHSFTITSTHTITGAAERVLE